MLETVREHSRPSRKEDSHFNVPRGAFDERFLRTEGTDKTDAKMS